MSPSVDSSLVHKNASVGVEEVSQVVRCGRLNSGLLTPGVSLVLGGAAAAPPTWVVRWRS